MDSGLKKQMNKQAVSPQEIDWIIDCVYGKDSGKMAIDQIPATLDMLSGHMSPPPSVPEVNQSLAVLPDVLLSFRDQEVSGRMSNFHVNDDGQLVCALESFGDRAPPKPDAVNYFKSQMLRVALVAAIHAKSNGYSLVHEVQ